ncbi:hypothetical protein [Burkholderia multivorans]|uniref:hypothetical protein n=1 Tax=Burkholderia multivorans TaxID=87883 RepID=UPI000AEE604C|nr:hypothetical protein [Burkholderia multivorans]
MTTLENGACTPGRGRGVAMRAIHAPNAPESRGAGYTAMRAPTGRIAPPSIDAPQ